jgi:hypothetical protein
MRWRETTMHGIWIESASYNGDRSSEATPQQCGFATSSRPRQYQHECDSRRLLDRVECGSQTATLMNAAMKDKSSTRMPMVE